MVFAGEMVGWEHILAMLSYSDTFRAYRKAMHRVLGTKTSFARFNELQERLGDLVQHIRTWVLFSACLMTLTAYGYDISADEADELVSLANEFLENFSVTGMPELGLLIRFRFAVKHLPSWFPGAGFKSTAEKWRTTLLTTIEKPYHLVRVQMGRGTYPDPYLSSLLEEFRGRSLTVEEERVIKWTAGSLHTGGADTTVSTLSTFFLDMALHPYIQKRAQEELDSLLGRSTLPTFVDREKLPYINAVIKESLRWHPVAPIGIPHMYNDVEINRAFTHDATIYPSPTTFNPSRFLSARLYTRQPPRPVKSYIRVRRRVCPGMILAESTIFSTIAKSLCCL
ncbi:cytochrome P450 [Aspergillus spectabilis]